MINKKTFRELQQQSFDYLLNNTDITQLTPGGAARSIVDITNQHLSEFYDTLDTDVSMAFASSARGFFLDLIGRLFGLGRIVRERTIVLQDDKVIKFFSNVAGAPLSKALPSRIIPAGTILTSTDGAITYTTLNNEQFSPMATEVFVSAQSTGVGLNTNVGANTLTTHNLGNSSVSVTNIGTIALGNDTEDDDSYRSRIITAATAAETSNATAVLNATRSIASVADITIKQFSRGSGTFDLFVIPEGNRVPIRTRTIIRNVVSEVVAYGISFGVSEPDYRQLKLEGVVRFGPNILDGEKQVLMQQAETALLGYIGDLRPGSQFIVSQALIAMLSPAGIIDGEIVFLCLDKRPQIIRNFILEEDELLIPDETSPNPIVVRPQ